ncbi:FYVE, RhoGEF and PH domain-containing protein 5-like isoform X2 [Dunckerocampus dactyliophorus]|uniref:FYVE, RhoGEF and PH domain-containing protein 5-like isoform X2 n=1 Tax=Dunckerocampus dactyliophorus TaxID=161453 RepID=UPI002406F039|nr:FYVE, RhoGEF and PH domain-containing protein 5-like isoform X2 [Dunckerocampus dactyliophorus]
MNTDKPCVAPKPAFVCPARLTLASAARSPKPSVAPKPILKLHSRDCLLTGTLEGCVNGGVDGDAMRGLKEDEPHPEKKEEALQKMDEDCRQTEEADSLDGLWTTDSEEAVEMIDTTDVTEDMDEDAGEALADADGLSMGDFSVNSVDEEKGVKKRARGQDKTDDESLADDLLSEASPPDGGGHQMYHTLKWQVALEVSPTDQPYYVAPEDIINKDLTPSYNGDCPLSPQTCFLGGVLAGKYHTSHGNQGPRRCRGGEEHKLDTLLCHLYSQPKFRLLCNSHTSENRLKDLEVRNDPGTCGDHLYEDPGDDSSEGENVFPLSRRTTGMRSRSLSHNLKNDAGDRLVHGPCMSRSSQKGPVLSSSPTLRSHSKPHYLALYPSSPHVHRDTQAFPSGSFSRCSPLSCSGLSTPSSVVDIPPPFQLAYITKRPITKSTPSLLTDVDSSEKNRKKKSSIKRFLMLKFRRKPESKPAVVDSPSSESSTDSSRLTRSRLLDLDRHSLGSSPHLRSHAACQPQMSPQPTPAFLFYPETKRKGSSVAFLNRSVVRVESFEDRSRVPFSPLPLTKPRSISFPNTGSSDYENVPAVNSDYENVHISQWRPLRPRDLGGFFERPPRVLSTTNETDGYVDMSSLPGFEFKTKSPVQEEESAYTEAYKVCPVAVVPPSSPVTGVSGPTAAEEDSGRISEEEDAGSESPYERQIDGRSRAFYIATELLDTERLHVRALKLLQEDFRGAVGAAAGDDGEPALDDGRLCEILNELPDVYLLHRRILNELEDGTRRWEESQRIADIFLCRKAEFLVFTTYIGHYDRSINLLDESCIASPAFAAIVRQFEQSPSGQSISLKQQLLQVIVRVAQYRMILTDYLNNLSPDSQEYEDTQAAIVMVSDIADQANDSLRHGENLLRLVNIEYSVHGQRDLLQPGRVFVKEGTLMKVSRRSRQPRHLFLMSDVLLYTYPQQDGKYRLKNTLSLTGLKVTKPIMENVHNALRMEGTDISITLSASSFLEREDWFSALSRTVSEHARGCAPSDNCSGEVRDGLGLTLGEKPPTLVPVSQVMMCMNCTSDFSLTLRRHHCHSCGRIVCRSCSKNRYPLKYLKDRMAKVCDHCYKELKKRGEDTSALPAKSSPRLSRASRPLSSVFQSIHPPNIWRHRKGTLSFNHQVSTSDGGSMSGSLHRSKKSKRNWKRLWFLLKDKVLYTYRGQEEKVASESLPLLGFTVKLPDNLGGDQEANVFQLYHKNTLYYTFKAEDNHTAQRWVNAMEEATLL